MSRSVATGFSFVVAGKVLVLVLGIVGSPILVRVLGTEPYGTYVFLFSLFSLYMTLVSPGVTDGVRKFLSENRDRPNWHDHVLGLYLRYAVVLALAGAVVMWFAGSLGLLGRFIEGDNLTLYIHLLALLVIAAQFRAYVRQALMGFKLEHYSESLRVLYKAGFLVGAIGFVTLGYGVVGVIAAHIVMSATAGAIGLFLILQRVSLREVVFPSTSDLPRGEMLSFNNLSILLILLITSLYKVDIILLRVLTGESAAAYYKVALVFAEFLWFVPVALQTVLLQSTSELFERGDYARIKAMSARITRYTTLLTTLLAIGIAVLAPTVIPIMYTPDFTASLLPLFVLLPGAFGFAVARPILSVGQASGRLRYLVLGTGVATFLNIGLNVVLIPRFGMLGAAVSTSVSYGTMLVMHIWSARHVGFDPLADLRPLRTLTTVAVSAPLIYLFANVLPGSILPIVLVPPFGLVVFTLLAFVTNALEPVEVTHFLGSLPGPFGDLAERVRRRLSRSAPSRDNAQRWLFALGAIFLAVGLVFSVAGAGLVPILGGGDDPDRTTTAPTTDATTPSPTTDTATAATTTTGDGTETTPSTTTQPTTTRDTPRDTTTRDTTTRDTPTRDTPTRTTTDTTTDTTTRTTTATQPTQTTTTETTRTTRDTTQATTTDPTTTQPTQTTNPTTSTRTNTTTSGTVATFDGGTTTSDTTTSGTTPTDPTTSGPTTTQSSLLGWFDGFGLV